jgi:hypothetical protein
MRLLKAMPVVVVTVVIGLGGTFDASAAAGDPDDRLVVVRGRATLDAASFDAEFLGAVVERHGLVTP